jgi:hypothetical protein
VVVLAGSFVEVAPGDNVPHLKSQAVVGLACKLPEDLAREVAVYVEVFPLGRLLEERVTVFCFANIYTIGDLPLPCTSSHPSGRAKATSRSIL